MNRWLRDATLGLFGLSAILVGTPLAAQNTRMSDDIPPCSATVRDHCRESDHVAPPGRHEMLRRNEHARHHRWHRQVPHKRHHRHRATETSPPNPRK
jgi:hypothetical protein